MKLKPDNSIGGGKASLLNGAPLTFILQQIYQGAIDLLKKNRIERSFLALSSTSKYLVEVQL